jgi:DNA polymerase III subunit delta
MDASVKKIMSALKGRKFDPVYFLQGEESYFIDRISDYIETHALSEAEKGFNQVIVYGKDVTMAVVLTHARRFPMMAERQVVIVKEAQDIQDLNKETGARLLLEYLKGPVPSTILVFCHKHKPLDKRRALGQNITKLATTISGKKLYDNQLPEFVQEYAAEKGVTIEAKAIQVLCESVGNDLSRLANEFDKLVISLKEGEVITDEQVMSQVGISREYNIFELQKSLIQRNTLVAAKIVNHFECNTRRNPIIPVVAFLYSFFSKLLIAAQSPDKSEKALVSVLKISPYAVRDYSQALRLYPAVKIVENIGHLKAADLKLKGVNAGSAGEGQILRELIYRLMH